MVKPTGDAADAAEPWARAAIAGCLDRPTPPSSLPMTSLDDTARALWNTTRPPLAILGAVGCARAASVGLSREDRAPFDALSAALLAWWPEKKRSARDICALEFGACLDRAQAVDHLELPLVAAYQEMGALMWIQPGNLRAYEIGSQSVPGEASFVELVRRAAKHTHTELGVFRGRFERLAAAAKTEPWAALVESATRMGFDRPTRPWSKLPEPLLELARLSDLGAVPSWSEVGGRQALVMQLGATRRTVALDDAQRAMLLEASPWLA